MKEFTRKELDKLEILVATVMAVYPEAVELLIEALRREDLDVSPTENLAEAFFWEDEGNSFLWGMIYNRITG